jgi:preprotein translocase subunit SecA
MLKRKGVPHNVLNAKFHEKEAEIISQAGKFKAVTIATNMAGRGTDIVLGGNPEFMAKNEMRKLGYHEDLISAAVSFFDTDEELILDARRTFKKYNDEFKKLTDTEREKVVELGGLCIMGTERHESRRIDNQLRGRSGRQGDPGASRFYISLEDDLMRLFGSDRLTGIVNALGLEEDQPIEHRMLSGAIENAQKRVEGQHFAMRKNVLQFDDVMNKQREIIYKQRRDVLNGESLKDYYGKMMESITDNVIEMFTSENPNPDYWDWEGMIAYTQGIFLPEGVFKPDEEYIEAAKREYLKEDLLEIAKKCYNEKEEELGIEVIRELERIILLRTVDMKWMDHIDAMDQLRNGIYLRAYAQRDPVIEYKFEGFAMFEEMIKNIQEEAVKIILHSHIQKDKELHREKVAEPINASHGGEETRKPSRSTKIGRNDNCSCGSGKKYKKCCGRNS